MLDYKPLLIRELSAILPTYYELFVDSNTETPCITIMESNNAAQEEGDTIRFSRISFNIKIWGDDISVIAAGNQCSAIYRYEILANEYL